MTPSTADLLTAALEQHRSGNTALAEQLYRQVLAAEPARADAWHCLGVLCLQTGRAADAAGMLERAVSLSPANAEFYNHLGAAYGALERHDESVATLRHAVRLATGSSETHYNLGTALRNAGRLEDAVVSFRHAIAANPRSAEAHYNLANSLRELKRYEEAETSYRDALAVRPNYIKAMINLGNVLRELKRLDESIEILRRAVALAPDHANAAQNLGTVLRDAGEFDEAVTWLRRAAELEPGSAETQNNLGTALQALTDFDGAIACYERALQLDASLAEAHFSRATWRLRSGDLAQGFAEYEWRWKCTGWRDRGFSQPRWDGLPLEGRTILLYAEQGLGDTLHFARYASEVKRRGGTVIVECQPSLVNILAGCRGIDRLVALGSPLPPFDVHAPLLSLPAIFKVSLESLERDAASFVPYLEADAVLLERWRRVLSRYDGFRIGLCWQGNPQYLFDSQRSFSLAQLSPVAAVEGARLFSLQKANTAQQMFDAGFEVIELSPPLDETAGAFMDTAAVMKQLDLVITTDTSIAHLAGALGVRVWTAVSAHPDWRWMFERADTPWYPTMRLFRQRHLNDWRGVFERMAAELRRLVRV